MEVTIRTDLGQVAGRLSEELRRQVPFAGAAALTKTAWDVAREGLVPELSAKFEFRDGGTRAWLEKGWRVQRATKATLTARISHRSPIVDKQVSPGRYTGRDFARERMGIYGRLDGAPEIAVRMPGVRTRSPKSLKKGFRIPVKNGSGGLKGLILKRTGKAGAQARRVRKLYGVSAAHAREFVRREGVQVMFGLFEDAKVVRPLDLDGASRRVYERRWEGNFDEAMAKAMRTAR